MLSLYKPYKHTQLSPSAPWLSPLYFEFLLCQLSKIISAFTCLCFSWFPTNSNWITSVFLCNLSPFSCMLSSHFLCLCFCLPQLLWDKQSLRIPKWNPLLELLFSNTLLIWLRTGWGPWPSLLAGVYGMRYAWNTFDLTEGFSHVFPTVTMVCGFKQILWMCVSVCVYAVLYVVCCQTMHDWPEILSYNLQWNVGPRDERSSRWETEMKG